MPSAQKQKNDWNEIGDLDALWAILSAPDKRHGAWDLGEFLQTGRLEVDAVLERAHDWQRPIGHARALDFGCGVGRLTGAMAAHFDACLGVDVSHVMVDRARLLHPEMDPASFATVADEPLHRLRDGAFDFIYSNLVLQHMRDTRLIEATIVDFMRLLASGGLLIFQVPSGLPLRRRIQLRPRLYAALRSVGIAPRVLYRRMGLHPIRMTAIAESVVVDLLEGVGGTVLAIDRRVLAETGIEDRTYFVTNDWLPDAKP